MTRFEFDRTLFHPSRETLRRGLERGEAHVWLTDERFIDNPGLLEDYRALLTEDERARCDRFVFGHDRHRALVSRALVRTTLSEYEPIAPEHWRFRFNRHGRPEIDVPGGPHELRFNLSHTKGQVACIVALDREVGVDVENRCRSGRLLDVARRFFSTREVADLEACAPNQRLVRFFTYWTLKESYIKARGLGLAIPLGDFSFQLRGPNDEIAIAFRPGFDDSPDRWSFASEHLSIEHTLAAAVERSAELPTRIVVHRAVPLLVDDDEEF